MTMTLLDVVSHAPIVGTAMSEVVWMSCQSGYGGQPGVDHIMDGSWLMGGSW